MAEAPAIQLAADDDRSCPLRRASLRPCPPPLVARVEQRTERPPQARRQRSASVSFFSLHAEEATHRSQLLVLEIVEVDDGGSSLWLAEAEPRPAGAVPDEVVRRAGECVQCRGSVVPLPPRDRARPSPRQPAQHPSRPRPIRLAVVYEEALHVRLRRGRHAQVVAFADRAEEIDVPRERESTDSVLDTDAVPVRRRPGKLIGYAENAQRGLGGRRRGVP